MPYYLITSDQIIYSNSSTSPGTGWVSTSFSGAVNQSISSNLPLFILPSTISIGPLSVTITSGTSNRLVMTAMPGTVTIQLNANGLYLFEVNDIPDVVIDGIVFDAQNHNLTENVGGQGSGIVRVTQSASTNVSINNCKIMNANNFVSGNPQAGIVVDGGSIVRISNTVITNCGYGVLSISSQILVSNCSITYGSSSISGSLDNGVVIFHPSLGSDGSAIEKSTIIQQSGSSTSAGNGNYGNGVLVYQGGLVRIINNIISSSHLSAIRVNAAFYTEVLGNNISGAVETGIFIECPGSGTTNNGGVVANNIINGAGQGISVANLGMASDGVTKFISVTGNQVFNVTQNTVPNETSITPGVGIVITGYTIAVANIVQNAAVCGIVVGTNSAAVDLICNDNYVASCLMGIAYSANASAGKRLICNNVISGFRFVASPSTSGYQYSGAIVSATYGSTTSYGVNISPNINYLRDSSGSSSNTDYGNTNVQTASLLIANNIAS
jgi:uncharacterized secreted repeat protein (TIGR03808 family)